MTADDIGKNKGGRPTKYETKRPTLSVRLRPEAHQRLKDAATKNGRSLSEEMEARLEQSLIHDEQSGGPTARRFLNLVSTALHEIQRDLESVKSQDWTQNAYARIMLEAAIIEALDYFSPKDRIAPLPGLLAAHDEAIEREHELRQICWNTGREITRRLHQEDVRTNLLGALEKVRTIKNESDRLGAVTSALSSYARSDPKGYAEALRRAGGARC